MARILGLFKGSQVFSNQQLGHFLLHYPPLTHSLLKREYGSKSPLRFLDLPVDTYLLLWDRVFLCEYDPSVSTVTRRQELNWETCGSRRQKLHQSLMRTAEDLAGMALSLPQDGLPKC